MLPKTTLNSERMVKQSNLKGFMTLYVEAKDDKDNEKENKLPNLSKVEAKDDKDNEKKINYLT